MYKINREHIVIFNICMYGAQCPGQASLSLFGGLCNQTLPPSNYVYIELSARLDASPALGCLHSPLRLWLARLGIYIA